jgi:hypothetical protein
MQVERSIRTGLQSGSRGLAIRRRVQRSWKTSIRNGVKAPVGVDLGSLWSQLGISVADGNVIFIDDAPLAAVRTAITTNPRP